MNALASLRRWLDEPTLQRRSVAFVLLAFLLVWAVLVAYQYSRWVRVQEQQQPFRKRGDAVLLSLEEFEDPREAAAALAATERWVNIRRREIGRLPGRVEFELRDAQGQVLRGGITVNRGPRLEYRKSGRRWTLRMAEPLRTVETFVAQNTPDIGEYLLLALPFVLVPVWLSVRNGLKPLQRFAQGLAGRSPDDLRPLAQPPEHRELKPLSVALDALLERLRQRFDRERVFVQDAAHELRTPLAVVQAQAHVMAQARSQEERQRAYGVLTEAIARASHVAQQLLLLARLDDGAGSPVREVDLAQCARAILAQLAPQAMARRMELSLEAPDRLRLPLDEPAFTSVLQNLVDNAIRYGREGGSIVVTLRGDDDRLSVQVQDDGPGIPAAEHALVFERFYRCAGQEVPGSGLGLAIVRQAAARMGGKALVTQGLQRQGVGFLVTLPVAGMAVA